MSEEEFGKTVITPQNAPPGTTEPGWDPTEPPRVYPHIPPHTPPGYVPPPTASAPGLSENAASALAYVTIIPAIIFLLVAPYNQSPRIKFHSIQMLALSVVGFIAMVIVSFLVFIPLLGLLIYAVTGLALLVVWILCIVKAAQGGAFKLPLLSDFAAKQSGYLG
jgi:uncharacterized membrane protein